MTDSQTAGTVDQEEVEQSTSLRDEIQSAFTAATENETEVKTVGQVDKAEKTEGPRTPARDQTGKFSKIDQAETQVSTAPTEVKTVEANTPPTSWSAEAKAAWSTLPPNLQAEIARREAEVHKGFTKQDDERSFGKLMKDVVTPYLAIIQAEGGTPDRAVKDLLNTAYLLRTAPVAQKAALIAQTAQQFGVPLEMLTQSQQGQAQVPPIVAELQRQIDELRQGRQQQEHALLANEITAFSSEPGHEHFEAVKAHMAALLQSGLAQGLKDAYDQAVWAQPDLRSTLLAQQQLTAEEQRKAEQRAAAQKARTVGSSVSGGPGSGSPANVNAERSLADELRANLRAATGRA